MCDCMSDRVTSQLPLNISNTFSVLLGQAAFVFNPYLTFLVCSQHTGWGMHKAVAVVAVGSQAQQNRIDFLYTSIPATPGILWIGRSRSGTQSSGKMIS